MLKIDKKKEMMSPDRFYYKWTYQLETFKHKRQFLNDLRKVHNFLQAKDLEDNKIKIVNSELIEYSKNS